MINGLSGSIFMVENIAVLHLSIWALSSEALKQPSHSHIELFQQAPCPLTPSPNVPPPLFLSVGHVPKHK